MNTPAPDLTLDELIGFLELCVQSTVTACPALRYDPHEPRDRFAVLLLYAVLDQARAVLTLARAGQFTAIPIIARTALDAYTDLVNLADHPRYWENLVAVDAAKWKSLLERTSQGGNPMLKGLKHDVLLPAGRRKYGRELKALRAKDVRTLEIAERFERAGLTHEYESVYSILSDEAHNNLSVLQSRYIDWDKEEAWIVRQGEVSKHSHHYELPCTLTMSEIVLRSTEKLLRLFGHGIAVVSQPLRELELIWARAQAEDARQERMTSSPISAGSHE
jgi:hypothetical protein